MVNIELTDISGIISDDSALDSLIKTHIGFGEDQYEFILPLGTSEQIVKEFDNFIRKCNFGYNVAGRTTFINKARVKQPEPVVVPAPAPEPEPIVVEEPVVAPAVFASKRKK